MGLISRACRSMKGTDSEQQQASPAAEICIAPDLRQSPRSEAKDLSGKFKHLQFSLIFCSV